MIPSDDNFVLEFDIVEQVEEIPEALFFASFGEVSSMDEDISIDSFDSFFDYFIGPVRVRNRNDL